jgi:hypothetical protein
MRGLSIHGYTRGCTAAFTYLQVIQNEAGAMCDGMTSTRTRRVMEEEAGKTSGRKDRLRGQIGVRTSALSDG